VGLTGDFGKLARWQRNIAAINSPQVAFEIADGMADVALGLIAETFGREQDPFGNRWKPKKKPDGRPILRGETNRLQRWRKAFVNQHGYRVASLAPYAGYHQSGTRRMVARRMAPTGNRLPAHWSSEFRGVFVRRMHSLLK
jgi:phage gpG-like protein